MSKETLQKITRYGAVGRVIQIVGAIGMLIVLSIALHTWTHVRFTLNEPIPFIQLVPLLSLSLIPILLIALGSAVRAHKNWARFVAMAFGFVSLIAFPIGTLLGIYILWSLAKGWKDLVDVNSQRQYSTGEEST